MAVEVYRVMFVNQVAVNINIIYSCLDIEMFKNFIHFIDWWLCRSHSAALPEWLGWNFPPLRAQSNVQYTKLKEQNYSYSVFDIRAIWHFCAFFYCWEEVLQNATQNKRNDQHRSTTHWFSNSVQFQSQAPSVSRCFSVLPPWQCWSFRHWLPMTPRQSPMGLSSTSGIHNLGNGWNQKC